MEILSLLKRSIHHPNFSEDFLFSHSLTKDILVAAVMDGCSSAKDSHFVSTLYSKSLYKSCRMLPQMKEILDDFDINTMDLEAIGNFIMNQLFDDLKKTKKLYFLNTEELLSTIVLLIYNKKEETTFILMSGDGFFSINGKLTEVDQNNIPNFLGYHLGKNFDSIQESEIQRWNFHNVKDVSIATDGIDKFKKELKNEKEITVLKNAFFKDKPNKDAEGYLEKQYDAFTKKGFTPHDDIGIIRVIKNN